MTVRIPIPLGVIRTLAVLALAWGGAAGIALGFTHWLDEEGVDEQKLAGYVTRSELDNYVTDSELAVVRAQIPEAGADSLVTPSLRIAVGEWLLTAVVTGQMGSDFVKRTYFPTASSSDWDTCIAWNAGRMTEQYTGTKACISVGPADFGP
jgi:hypothetical protein